MNIIHIAVKKRHCQHCGLSTTIEHEHSANNTIIDSMNTHCPLCFVPHNTDITTENRSDFHGQVIFMEHTSATHSIIMNFNKYSGVSAFFQRGQQRFFLLTTQKCEAGKPRESIYTDENKKMFELLIDRIGVCCIQTDHPLNFDLGALLYIGYSSFSESLQHTIGFNLCANPLTKMDVASNSIN